MNSHLVRLILDCSPWRIAETVLLPAGDFVRQRMIEKLKEVKKYGKVHTGRHGNLDISVVESGMGAPSAAIILEVLARTKVKNVIRLDFCGGIADDINIGDVVVSPTAIRGEGTTPHYFPGNENMDVGGNVNLSNHFVEQLKQANIQVHVGPVYSHDALFKEPESLLEKAKKFGAIAIDMETSTIYALSKLHDLSATSIMIISDHPAKKKFFYEKETFKFKIIQNLDKAIDAVLDGLLKLQSDESKT
jgi:purine-nucleoside phosphorylase